jgi:hypothetical protein
LHTPRTDAVRPRTGRPMAERPVAPSREHRITTRPEQRRTPNYANARYVQPDELWRRRGNGGREITPDLREYIAVYRRVRDRTVDALERGDLYQSGAAFAAFLKSLHRTPGLAENYNRLNPSKPVDRHEIGMLRNELEHWGQPWNSRTDDAREAIKVALEYGDPYGASSRLERGRPNSTNEHLLRLPGIPERYLPRDTVSYDSAGYKLPRDGYTFVYPPSAAIPVYMSQIARLGQEIDAATRGGSQSYDEILRLIAQQYQYGAAIRPFAQINNSLFVNLANAQIKLLGLKGLTHESMDMVAQRVRPETFARYFVDRVREANGKPPRAKPSLRPQPRPDYQRSDPTRRFGDTYLVSTSSYGE